MVEEPQIGHQPGQPCGDRRERPPGPSRRTRRARSSDSAPSPSASRPGCDAGGWPHLRHRRPVTPAAPTPGCPSAPRSDSARTDTGTSATSELVGQLVPPAKKLAHGAAGHREHHVVGGPSQRLPDPAHVAVRQFGEGHAAVGGDGPVDRRAGRVERRRGQGSRPPRGSGCSGCGPSSTVRHTVRTTASAAPGSDPSTSATGPLRPAAGRGRAGERSRAPRSGIRIGRPADGPPPLPSTRAARRREDGARPDPATRSKKAAITSAPDTPSMMAWCTLGTSAMWPLSSPSTTWNSHSGRGRSSGREARSAARAASSGAPARCREADPAYVVVDVELGIVGQ